jgi:hypothetical protein
VVKDVPAGALVFGVPARVVRHLFDPVAEYERDTGRTVPESDRPRSVDIPQPAQPNPPRTSTHSPLEEEACPPPPL